MRFQDKSRRLRGKRRRPKVEEEVDFDQFLGWESFNEDMQWYAEFPPSKILDRLYLGNVYNAMELAYNGNPLKITAVLNVSTEPAYDLNPDILYLHIPFDDGHEIPARQFAECMAFLKFCWENGHKILVHCAAGISRSTSVVISFIYHLKLMEGTPCYQDFDKIHEFVAMCRHIVHPNPRVIGSCRKWLRLWPYDGSYYEAEPEGKLLSTILSVTGERAAAWHTDPDCPVKAFLLSGESDKAAHEIPCTCKKLSSPLDRAKELDKIYRAEREHLEKSGELDPL